MNQQPYRYLVSDQSYSVKVILYEITLIKLKRKNRISAASHSFTYSHRNVYHTLKTAGGIEVISSRSKRCRNDPMNELDNFF